MGAGKSGSSNTLSTESFFAEIRLSQIGGSESEQLAKNNRHFGAEWSPDSKTLLVYDNFGSGNSDVAIYRLTSAGGRKSATPTAGSTWSGASRNGCLLACGFTRPPAEVRPRSPRISPSASIPRSPSERRKKSNRRSRPSNAFERHWIAGTKRAIPCRPHPFSSQ